MLSTSMLHVSRVERCLLTAELNLTSHVKGASKVLFEANVGLAKGSSSVRRHQMEPNN